MARWSSPSFEVHSRGKPSTRLATRFRFTSVVPTATPAVIARRNCASANEPYASASASEEFEREIRDRALGERAGDARDVGIRARRLPVRALVDHAVAEQARRFADGARGAELLGDGRVVEQARGRRARSASTSSVSAAPGVARGADALVVQRVRDDVPALAFRAEPARDRHARVAGRRPRGSSARPPPTGSRAPSRPACPSAPAAR